MTGPQAILADYVRNGSDRAFRELVNSYLNFVYSTALRALGGNRPLAEDVSQTVFIDLARKAAGLPADVSLAGWLHRHTCFLAHKALRRELRLKARERRAIELRVIDDYTEENLGEVSAVLDEAINDLGTEDRTAILLRFFEQLDFQSVGKALGRSEDAARMRVSRALEKLGSLLKRRGITSSAAGLGFVLETKSVAAVGGGLANSISKAALSSAAKGGSAFALIKEACFTRLNIGLVSASVVIGLATLFFATRQSVATSGFAVSRDDPDEWADSTQDEPAAETIVKSDTSPVPNLEPKRESPSESPVRPKSENPVTTVTRARPVSPLPIRTAAAPVPTPAAQPVAAANPMLSQRPGIPPGLTQLKNATPAPAARAAQTGNGNARSSVPNPSPPLMASPWQTMATIPGLRTDVPAKGSSQPAPNLKTAVEQPVNAPAQNTMLSQNRNAGAPPVVQTTAFTPVRYAPASRANSRLPRKDPRLP